jgi:four helix bundle protein
LSSQLRRASASVPTNIAEDSGRGSENELRQFLQIAMGSVSELEYLLVLSKDLGYLTVKAYNPIQNYTRALLSHSENIDGISACQCFNF